VMSENIVAVIFPTFTFPSTPFLQVIWKASIPLLMSSSPDCSGAPTSQYCCRCSTKTRRCQLHYFGDRSEVAIVKILFVRQHFRHPTCCTPCNSRVIHWQCTLHGHLRSWMSPVTASAINVWPHQCVWCYWRAISVHPWCTTCHFQNHGTISSWVGRTSHLHHRCYGSRVFVTTRIG
jgi:hypothetical protein